MGFEELLSSLEEKGKAQEREVLSAAQAEARKIAKNSEHEAQKILEKAQHAGQAEGNEQKAEMYAAARLRAKRIIAEAREKAVENVLAELRDEMYGFTKTKEYSDLLVKLAKSGVKAIGPGAVVKARKEDEKNLRSAGLNMSPILLQCLGGVIVETADGRVRVNNTLESLLEQFTPQLKQRAYEELFGKAKKFNLPQQMNTESKANTMQTTANKTKPKKKSKQKNRNQ